MLRRPLPLAATKGVRVGELALGWWAGLVGSLGPAAPGPPSWRDSPSAADPLPSPTDSRHRRPRPAPQPWCAAPPALLKWASRGSPWSSSGSATRGTTRHAPAAAGRDGRGGADGRLQVLATALPCGRQPRLCNPSLLPSLPPSLSHTHPTQEEGFNGIEVLKAQDCWVHDVALLNVDNGLLVSNAARVTVEVRACGRVGVGVSAASVQRASQKRRLGREGSGHYWALQTGRPGRPRRRNCHNAGRGGGRHTRAAGRARRRARVVGRPLGRARGCVAAPPCSTARAALPALPPPARPSPTAAPRWLLPLHCSPPPTRQACPLTSWCTASPSRPTCGTAWAPTLAPCCACLRAATSQTATWSCTGGCLGVRCAVD